MQPTAPPALPVASAQALDRHAFAAVQTDFESVGDADSVPQSVVSALALDAKGMLWVGSQAGLIRYDGYRFRVFAHDRKDPATLAGNYVNSLWGAPDGRVWVGTASDGLSVYDPRTEAFRSFHHDAAQPGSLSNERVNALVGDASGNLWIGTDKGLDYLAAGSSVFRHFRQDEGLGGEAVHSLLREPGGRLWLGSSHGLFLLRQDGQHFDPIAATALREQEVKALMMAADGKLWLGTRGHGAAWLEPATQRLHWLGVDPERADQLSYGSVGNIVQARADEIWLGTTGGGINVVAAADGRVLRHMHNDPAVPSSLAIDTIGAMLIDRSGLLWVGTWGGGLQRHNPGSLAIRNLRHSSSLSNSLSEPNVQCMLDLGDGHILIGVTGNGIDDYDRRRGVVGGFRAQMPGGRGLGDGLVRGMARTRDGSIWAGTRLAGVLRYRPASGRWEGFTTERGVPHNGVLRLLAAHDGTLWVGTESGAARLAPGATRFEPLRTAQGELLRARVKALAEDKQGRIWAGTPAGLWMYAPGAPGVRVIRHEGARADSLVNDNVNGLLVDRGGRLWVDTALGLERLLGEPGQAPAFEHISTLAGRPGMYLGGNLLEDARGRIWTQWAVLDTARMHIDELSKADGIDIGTGWIGSYDTTPDGLFLYGGTHGMAIVDPDAYVPWRYHPPVVATELTIDGVRRPSGGLEQGLSLAAGEHNFTIEFAALDYSAPQHNRYAYRLLGEQREWIDSDAGHRSASYGNLWPGRYTLEVRGTNRNGEWSEQTLRIPITVLPAFWQTGGFLVLALLCSAAALYGGYRWRVLHMQAEAQTLQRAVQARTADILQLGAIGQELTATLDTEQAFERMYRHISPRLDTYVFALGTYDEAAGEIRLDPVVEAGERQKPVVFAMDELQRPAVWCVRERRPLVTRTHADLAGYLGEILPVKFGRTMESVVYLPLIVEQRVIGCLSVQSPEPDRYSPNQLEFLHVLANYVAIAVANARAHRSLTDAQQQLVLQEKMAGLGTLTAGVAHEINNPTNFAHVAAQNLRVDIAEFQHFTDALIETDAAPEVRQAFEQRFARLSGHVTTMLNGTERIRGIVKDLRSFTRMDQAQMQTVRLSDCLLSTLNLVRTSWQDRVEFVCAWHDDPELACWPALLNQVFMNLLINGCQAIAERPDAPGLAAGRIALSMRSVDGQLEIAFADNGTGMPEEVRAHILEPFFTTKPVGQGTGLGLSIAYGIIVQHGGQLRIESVPGEGTVCTVSLPLTNGAAPPPA